MSHEPVISKDYLSTAIHMAIAGQTVNLNRRK